MSQSTLIEVRRSEVPAYLHSSGLYLSLNPDETDKSSALSIPFDCMKHDLTIKDDADLRNLLLTMRFWILETFPDVLIVYLTHSHNPGNLFSEFESVFPNVGELVRQINLLGIDQACNMSAKFGRVDFLEFFAKTQKNLSFKTLRLAAEHGHLSCLTYCYRYLTSRGPLFLRDHNWSDVIQNGHYHCISFLVECGVPIDKWLSLAKRVGSVGCLKYLHETFQADCWGPATMAEAAATGPLELVKQLHELGCPWDESAPIAALRVDQAGCLMYLIDKRGIPTSAAFREVKPGAFCILVLYCYNLTQKVTNLETENAELKEQIRCLSEVKTMQGELKTAKD